jgi:hypothetical protein
MAILCHWLLEDGNASHFSSSTVPSLQQACALMLDGARMLDIDLAKGGLTTPLTGSLFRGVLGPINEMWAAGTAFRIRHLMRGFAQELVSEEGDRGGMWLAMARERLDSLLEKEGLALANLGAAKSVALSKGLGAVSISIGDKESAWEDDDWVKPKFYIDQFSYTSAAS